jgi:hypothetical protein
VLPTGSYEFLVEEIEFGNEELLGGKKRLWCGKLIVRS